MSDRAPPTRRAIFLTMPAPGFLRSTRRWPVLRRCQPRNGKLTERGLGHDPQLQRNRGEDNRDVVDALVIRREHVAAMRVELVEPAHRHAHAGRAQQQPGPRPRAPVTDVAARIDERRQDRDRAENDRVNGDRRNQEEDRPPPVIRRNHFAFCWARPAVPVDETTPDVAVAAGTATCPSGVCTPGPSR